MNPRANIVTQQTGNGPIMALDFATIPDALKMRILRAASQIAMDAGMGYVAAEDEGPEHAQKGLDELLDAFKEVEKLYKPVTPGSDLYGSSYFTKEYPVYRDGVLVKVPRTELTPIELSTTIQRLQSDAATYKQHAEDLIAGRTTHGGEEV